MILEGKPMFAKITTTTKGVRHKLLNLGQITHVEIYDQGGSTVHFGPDHFVRLDAEDTQAFGDAIAKAEQIISTE